MRVLKFGGSSVADADRIGRVAEIVLEARRGGPLVVVVSALGGVTDELARLSRITDADIAPEAPDIADLRERHLSTLLKLAPGDVGAARSIENRLAELDRLIKGIAYIGACPPAVRDRIMALGERLSTPIIAAALRAKGVASQMVDGSEVIRTDSSFGGASVDQPATDSLARRRLGEILSAAVPVVTGFVGGDSIGSTTTLGRGGSDLSATVLGASLAADRVEIWTDVNGIFTAPPGVVPGARPQPFVSYDEASEMARFGAAVLFSKTVAPVRDRSIPVIVRNTFRPDGPWTVVDEGPEIPMGARSLASVENAVVLKVHSAAPGDPPPEGVESESARCLLASLAAASGEWTLVTEQVDADAVHHRLSSRGLSVSRIDDASVVAVVGSRLLQQPWVAGRALEALGRRDIALLGMVSPSEHSVCIVVERSSHDRTLTILHEALMLAHLANRASDSIRMKLSQQGDEDDPTTFQGRRDRRHRHRRPAARPPAA